MKKKNKKENSRITENPYKTAEFEAFIDIIKGSTVAYWVQIATALGINKDTITIWKRHPRARKATLEGIEHALEEMKRAGNKDWRMWESRLKMLGVAPVERSDMTSGDEPLDFGNLTNEQLDKFIDAKIGQNRAGEVAGGEGEKKKT